MRRRGATRERSAEVRAALRAQRRAWDRNAAAWVGHVSGDGGFRALLDPVVLRALAPVAGRTFLDAGCGEGRFCRALADRGAAAVLGIDLSPALVRAARRAERSPVRRGRRGGRSGTEPVYRAGDAARLGRPDRFDRILAYLSLQHWPDPLAALRAWRDAMRPGGVLVVVLPHPFTQSPGSAWQVAVPPVPGTAPEQRESFRAGDYFEPAWLEFRFPGRFRAPTRNRHLPLAEWSALFAAAGLSWTRVYEPRPTATALRRHPEWAPLAAQPYFLVLRAEVHSRT